MDSSIGNMLILSDTKPEMATWGRRDLNSGQIIPSSMDKSMNITLLKKEKKDSLAHEKEPGWKDIILDTIFGIVEISLDEKKDAKITPVDIEGSLSNSKLAGLDNAEAANGSEEIDDDFAVIDDDIWQRLVHPWTLQFLSPKREELYFRTNLLPIRILVTRLYSALLLILLSINSPIIYTMPTTSFPSTIWIISIILTLIIMVLSWVEKGKYYVDICLESKSYRMALFSCEVSF